MIQHPGMEDQTQAQVPAQEKLVLPAPPDETPRPYFYADSMNARIAPGQLIRQRTPPPPKGTGAKLAYYWRKDPAYKVFMLAVAVAVVAGLVFVSLASAALLGKPLFGTSTYTQNPPTSTVPTGTVDARPSFPTPGGGKGGTQTSQPPAQSTPSLGSTPTVGVTSTPGPGTTPTGQPGTLTVQITSFSPAVVNGKRTNITVATNAQGVTVTLQIRANIQPRNTTAGPQITNTNGVAVISWFVLYYGFGSKTATATIVAVAVDQSGQQAVSAPVTVQIVMVGIVP